MNARRVSLAILLVAAALVALVLWMLVVALITIVESVDETVSVAVVDFHHFALGMKHTGRQGVPVAVEPKVPLQRLVQQRPSPLIVTAVVADLRQGLQRFQGLGVVGTGHPAPLFEGLFEGLAGRLVLAAGLVDEAKDVLQLCPHRRCLPQQVERARLRPLQELPERQAVTIGPQGGVRGLEELDQHADDLLGRVAL